MQDTTEEFGHRLRVAVEGHPSAPPVPQGRQKWLRDRLEKEAKINVSPNTINKWYRGLARPREDNIRAIARLLQVDEVWLAMGRKPIADRSGMEEEAVKASGSVLLVAGMIEMMGGKVTFADPSKDSTVNLYANLGHGHEGVVIVTAQGHGEEMSFLIPEPVGKARILGVIRCPQCKEATAAYHLFDLTEMPRQKLGGFSAIPFKARDGGKIKIDGQRNLVASIKDLDALLSA